MRRSRVTEDYINPNTQVGEIVTINGLQYIVTLRREMPKDDCHNNAAEFEFCRVNGRGKKYYGGVKKNGNGWVIG